MGDPYVDVSVLNYNDGAPADDGSQVPANKVQWSTVKNEIGDPLKTAVESINTNVGSAVDKLMGGGGVTSVTPAYTVQASDQGKLVVATSSGTVTTATAATVGSPFVHGILNNSSGTLTVEGAGSETVDGQTNITLPPGAGVVLFTDGTNWLTTGRGKVQGAESYVTSLPRGYRSGCNISNNATDTEHDIDFSAGAVRDAGDSKNITLSSSLTKRIDASWSTGDNGGGLASAVSLSANTTYHCFVVDKTDGTFDAGFDTSLTATNLLSDSGGSAYRYCGSVVTDSSSNILQFIRAGNHFTWVTSVQDNNGTVSTSRVNVALTVPTGIRVMADIFGYTTSSGAGWVLFITNPDLTDEAAGTGSGNCHAVGELNGDNFQGQFMTDTSGRISIKASQASTTVRLKTRGFLNLGLADL